MSQQISPFIEPNYGENAYVVWSEPGGPCWIIDPGLPPSPEQILAHIERHNLTPDALILTHGHLDHIAGVPAIRAAFPELPVRMPDGERAALTDPNENLSTGVGLALVVGEVPTSDLAPGDELKLGDATWKVLDVSGHSPAGRAIYCQRDGIVIVGDALFYGSIGNTAFHHSDHETLIRNIREHLFALPPETKVYCGHGPATTIGREMATNPFLT